MLCRRPRGGGNRPVMGCDRTLGEGDPWYGAGIGCHAQASGVTSARRRVDKERASFARFLVVNWYALILRSASSRVSKDGYIASCASFETRPAAKVYAG